MRLLDLFCGAGGAAMGYHQAGFDEIVGVDIVPQPDYPFEFIQMDALKVNKYHLSERRFDLIHASPPCQAYTTMANRHGRSDYAVINATRSHILAWFPVPYVIENVAGARGSLHNPIELTGEMFGLSVHRPRLFELGGWYTLTPPRPAIQAEPVAVYGKSDGRRLYDRKDGSMLRAWSSLEEGQQALGVPWITDWHQVREAIPPAYTRFIGEQFINSRMNPNA